MLRSFNQAYLGVITPIYLLARGASAAEVGVLVTVWAAGSAVLGLAAGFLGDRFGRKTVLVGFSALSAVAALAFYFDLPLCCSRSRALSARSGAAVVRHRAARSDRSIPQSRRW